MTEKVECKHCEKRFDSEAALQQHQKDAHSRESKILVVEKKQLKKFAIYLIIVLAFLGIGYGIFILIQTSPKIGVVGSTHIHVDVKVFVNGLTVDFSQSKYQLRSRYVHFENGDGDVAHIHATGVTVGFLLDTLVMKLDNRCLILDSKEEFCNEGNKTIKFFVNGVKNYEYENYEFRDLDKILISFGNENEDEIRNQLNSITNLACEESKKPC